MVKEFIIFQQVIIFREQHGFMYKHEIYRQFCEWYRQHRVRDSISVLLK